MPKFNGNGHKGNGQGANPFELPAIDDIDGAFTSVSQQDAIKTLTEPGDILEKLLMRAHFKDENQRTLAVLAYQVYQDLGMKKEIDMLRNLIASSVSIDGLGRRQVVEVATGGFSSEYERQKNSGIFSKKNKKKEQQQDSNGT